MNRILVSVAVLSVSAQLLAFAQEESALPSSSPEPALETQAESNLKALSLSDCVQIGLEHNLDIKINRFAPEISEYNYSMAYAGYDPVLNTSYTYGFSKNPGSLDPGTTIINLDRDIYSDSLSSSLSMLSPSGGTVSLSGNYNRSGFSSGMYNMGNNDQFNANGAINLRQPLLKNFWIDGTRMGIKVAKKNMEVSQLTYEYSLMTTIYSIENAYYSLIGAREDIIAAEQNLSQAEEFLEETRKKVELGSLIDLDTKDAESRVSSAKSSLIAIRQAYMTAANTLRSLLSDNFTLWQDTDFELTDELISTPTLPSRAESWFKGMTMRPDLLQMKKDLENRDIYVRYSYNQLFPQLDLLGSYGHSGASLNNGARSLTQASQGTYPRYTVGGQLSMPLGNISARNTYKTRKAEREQSILSLKQKEQNVMVEIDNAINSVNSSLEAIVSTRDARKYAEQAWEAGKIRLDHGKATSFEVLQLQTTVFQNRLAEIRALVTYNINLSTLRYREGGTLEKYNIVVDYE
ncbi:MAG: TolC family protein [Verrucomicrobia bacterium]|nr:TolC family protein [Verrucomicrobiota bacterium]